MVYNLRSDGGELGGAALARIEEINLDIGYTITKRFGSPKNDPLSAQAELPRARRHARAIGRCASNPGRS